MLTKTFHVSGMHCSSCKLLIEDIVGEQASVTRVAVDQKRETVTVEMNAQVADDELLAKLNTALAPHTYQLSIERAGRMVTDHSELWWAVPIGVIILALFVWLQKSGVMQFGLAGEVTPLTSFMVGLVASVSSCLAVVGGLVLSLSATVAKDEHGNKRPIWLFHSGRLIGFAVLGGLLGLLGEAVSINFTVSAIIGVLASTIMIILGLNLLGIFSRNHLTLPTGLFSFFRKIEHEALAPFIVGVGTFFLPCGFTQSMQFMALSSGSFLTGTTIMLGFALGTLPVLATLSFGSASLVHSKHAPLFFKVVGVVVLGMGTIALLAGLTGLGIIPPLFTL